MDLTSSKYDFEKKGEQITGYSISEINKIIIKLLDIQNGITRIKLKTF